MLAPKLQSTICQVVSLFILTSFAIYPATVIWVSALAVQEKTNPYQWFSMEDLLQQAELSGLGEEEVDCLGFANFCNQQQIKGSFAERREQVKIKVVQYKSELQESFKLKQSTNGTISPFLSEADYSLFPEIEVTNTSDIGPGSLRDAVAKAETMSGSRIVFRLRQGDSNFNPQTGVWTIEMKSILYIRANKLFIDGFSQTQFAGNTNPNGPEIRILNSTTLRENLQGENGTLLVDR